MKCFDVTAMGELLIDFIQYGMSEQGNPLFEANPGGAPCNVLSMLSGLSDKVAFIGKVGDDSFGYILRDSLVEQGIDTTGLRYDNKIHTTLALVHKLDNGDRDFSFYRKPGADMCLTAEEIDEELIAGSKIFHFGSLSLTDEAVRGATMKALNVAHDNDVIVSFDPNLREPLWESLEEAKAQIDVGMKNCSIMKISDNEITWFTGIEDYDAAADYIMKNYPDIKLMMLSLGKDGSRAFYRTVKAADNSLPDLSGDIISVTVPAFIQEGTIETTGAGDTFMGSMLHHVLLYGLDGFDEENLVTALTFANAAASIITTRKGALRVMPKSEEVEAFLRERRG